PKNTAVIVAGTASNNITPMIMCGRMNRRPNITPQPDEPALRLMDRGGGRVSSDGIWNSVAAFPACSSIGGCLFHVPAAIWYQQYAEGSISHRPLALGTIGTRDTRQQGRPRPSFRSLL